MRIARELAGLSQAQLADEVGISPAAVSQFEGGAARPSNETIANMSTALNVPIGFFGQPLTETHEGFFRSLRRTAVTDRRRAEPSPTLPMILSCTPPKPGGSRSATSPKSR